MNSKVFSVALAIITVTTAWSGHAFATQPGNNGNGNGGCGNGQQTNGCGTTSTGGGTTTVTANPTASASAGALAGAAAISTSTGGTGYGGAGGQGGSGGKGGDGGNAAAVQGQHQSNTSANTNSVTGYGGSAQGNGAGNTTSLTFGGSTFQEAAQGVPLATPPATPKTCRIFIAGSGSNRDGTGGGIVPLWKDNECLAVTKVQVMAETNAAARAMGARAPFGVDSLLAGACQVDGMRDEIPACKGK